LFTMADLQPYDSWFMRYPKATNQQAPLMGKAGPAIYDWCATGTLLTNCAAPIADAWAMSQLVYDSVNNQWVGLLHGVGSLRAMPEGGNLAGYAIFQTPPVSVAIAPDASAISYCSQSTGHVHTYVFSGAVEFEALWPIPSIACTGYGMYYDDAFNLVVPFKSGHLWGVLKHHGALPN
jgi:hypothetical protein